MKRSENQRSVDKALLTLQIQGQAVTFRAVAELAGLSRSTLYRSDRFRELVQKRREETAKLKGLTRYPGFFVQREVLDLPC